MGFGVPVGCVSQPQLGQLTSLVFRGRRRECDNTNMRKCDVQNRWAFVNASRLKSNSAVSETKPDPGH